MKKQRIKFEQAEKEIISIINNNNLKNGFTLFDIMIKKYNPANVSHLEWSRVSALFRKVLKEWELSGKIRKIPVDKGNKILYELKK